MNHLITLIIASLVERSVQGFTGAPIRWRSRIVMPISPAMELPGSAALEQLIINDPPQTMSRNNVPYFTFKSDSTIVWEGTDRCIEAAGGKRGDAVHLNRCTGEPAQTWNWIPDNHGGNLIQLKDTDKCLDASVEGGSTGAPIVLWECESNGAGAWKFEEPGSLPARGWFTVMHLVTLAGVAALGLSAFLRMCKGSRKSNLAQGGATSTLDSGGVFLSSPLTIQLMASPTGGSTILRGGNVRMSVAGGETVRRSGNIVMTELFEDYIKKQQELIDDYMKNREATAELSNPGLVQANEATGEEEYIKKQWELFDDYMKKRQSTERSEGTGFAGGEATHQPDPAQGGTPSWNWPRTANGDLMTVREQTRKRQVERQEGKGRDFSLLGPGTREPEGEGWTRPGTGSRQVQLNHTASGELEAFRQEARKHRVERQEGRKGGGKAARQPKDRDCSLLGPGTREPEGEGWTRPRTGPVRFQLGNLANANTPFLITRQPDPALDGTPSWNWPRTANGDLTTVRELTRKGQGQDWTFLGPGTREPEPGWTRPGYSPGPVVPHINQEDAMKRLLASGIFQKSPKGNQLAKAESFAEYVLKCSRYTHHY